jgi:hypothetical protein
MKTWLQALRLALIIEASTLLVFLVSISRTVTDVLFAWFVILNIPTMLLFRSHRWESHGREMIFPLVVIPIVAIQTGFWFLVWYALIWTFRKTKAKLRHKRAA